jgi:hypothetical protein
MRDCYSNGERERKRERERTSDLKSREVFRVVAVRYSGLSGTQEGEFARRLQRIEAYFWR